MGGEWRGWTVDAAADHVVRTIAIAGLENVDGQP